MNGLTGIVKRSLGRAPVRLRQSDITQAAWRLEVTCDQGAGAILLVELGPQASCYRGEGVFLGWKQGHLAEAYQSLTSSSAGDDFQLLQLG